MPSPRASDPSLPLFDHPFLDRLTRTPPVVVPLLYGPAVATLLAFTLTRGGLGLAEAALLFAAGLLTWTFCEYWIHRRLFH